MLGGIRGSPEVLGGVGALEGAACVTPECQLLRNSAALRRGEPSAPEPAVVARAEKRGSWGRAQGRTLRLVTHTPPDREQRWVGGSFVPRRVAAGRAGVQPAGFVDAGCVCLSLRICSGTEYCTFSDSYKRAPGGLPSLASLVLIDSNIPQILIGDRLCARRCAQDMADMGFAFLKEGVRISRFMSDLPHQF